MKSIFTTLLFSLFLAVVSSAQQTVVWSEDFADGLSGWETIGISPATALWTYTSNGAAAGAFFAGTIQGASASNGAVIFDADFATTMGDPNNAPTTQPYPAYQSELISPIIDLSGETTPLSLRFAQMVVTLNDPFDLPPTSFQISTDGGATWGDAINANDDLDANMVRNNSKRVFPLEGIQGVSQFRIKFTFAGDFYSWTLDDIELVQRECNNIRINTGWVCRADNAQYPKSQVSTINYMSDIANIGGCDATNVQLNILMRRATTNLYQDSLHYGTIGQDSVAENQIFDQAYNMDSIKGTYTCRYILSSDSVDFDIADNSFVYAYTVTDSTFAKERGSTRNVLPSASNWDLGEKHTWGFGNYFYVPNGNGYEVTSVFFGIQNPDELAGSFVTLKLYEIADEIANTVSISTSERTLLAFGEYEFTGNESMPFYKTVKIYNFLDEMLPVSLQDNKGYIVMAEYVSANEETTMTMMACDSIDYGPAIWASEQLGTPRFGPILAIGNDNLDVDFSTNGFGRSLVPVVRMNVNRSASSSTKDVVLDDSNKVLAYPNPANQSVNIEIQLAEMANNATLHITDVFGKIISQQPYSNLYNKKLNYDCSNFAPGVYFAKLTTEKGYKVAKFTVQH
ncbi:MAG: T9SS type A sorting domain-containing protein [Saprospiraceae bacterium]|nr:T9SS type A sorting domain-containing protein [Saprospiraceae bacterium]